MQPSERIRLSPLEKWHFHHRFPWKLVCHVVLLLLTSSQILLYNVQNSMYIRATYQNWRYFFLPGRDARSTKRMLFTVQDTMTALDQVRDSFYSIVETSIANYEHVNESPMLEIVFSNGTRRSYNVTRSTLPPFDDFRSDFSKMIQYLQAVKDIRVHLRLRDQETGPFYSDCFEWKVTVAFQLQHHSQIRAEIQQADLKNCQIGLTDRFIWLNLLIFLAAAIYFVLSVRSLVRSIRLFIRARQAYLRTSPEIAWKDLPLSVKTRFIQSRFIVIGLSLLLLMLSSVWNVSQMMAHLPTSQWHSLVQASGCALLWASCIGYLQHHKRFYAVVLTIRWGLPRVLRFLVGVLPVFIGYSLFGTIYFGTHVDGFSHLSTSMMTLFAVMNGDEIFDTFEALSQDFPIASQVFLYSFIALFMYVVLNVFIAIIEEAYFATTTSKRVLEYFSKVQSATEQSDLSTRQQQERFAEQFEQLIQALEKD